MSHQTELLAFNNWVNEYNQYIIFDFFEGDSAVCCKKLVEKVFLSLFDNCEIKVGKLLFVMRTMNHSIIEWCSFHNNVWLELTYHHT